MTKRGIRIEKPVQEEPSEKSQPELKKANGLPFFYRLLLTVSFLTALVSLGAILTMIFLQE